MPSLSPGDVSPSPFAQVLPGAPTQALQSLTTYTFRWKRYIVYASGQQLNFLRSPTELVQAITFEEDLVGVKAEDGDAGKIAVASSEDVWILEPQTDNRNRVTWRKTLRLRRDDLEDKARTLCWGSEGELLIGGSKQLSLYSTLPSSRNSTPASSPIDRTHVEERHALWSKTVSSPIQHAAFSPSAGLIVSCGERDRLVKIWRRLSFEEGLFDHAYLPHPSLVTHVEWRTPDPPQVEEEDLEITRVKSYSARHEDEPEILYTFCADGVLRIWKTGGHHDLEMLTLHSTIDLVMAIPQSPSLTVNGAGHQHKPARYAFLLPAGALSTAISAAISKRQLDAVSHSIEHLKEISSKHPDIVVTLDGHGRMSAWGVESIDHKRRPSTPSGSLKQAFHVAHAEDVDVEISDDSNARFETWFDGDVLHFLAHSFDGTVSWYSGPVEKFFSPSAVGQDRLQRVAAWTGGQTTIQGISNVDADGSTLAWSTDGEVAKVTTSGVQGLTVQRSFSTMARSEAGGIVTDAIAVGHNTAILCLSMKELSLWTMKGKLLAKVAVVLSQPRNPRLLSLRPGNASAAEERCLLYNADGQYSLVALVSARDAARSKLSITRSGVLPILNGDVAHNGSWADTIVKLYSRKPGWLRLIGVGKDGTITHRDVDSTSLSSAQTQPMQTSAPLSIVSGVERPGLVESTSDLMAITSFDHSTLAILDLEEGYLEHRQSITDAVKAMRFSTGSNTGAHKMLALAYPEFVDVLAQGFYRSSKHSIGGIWQHVKRMSLTGIGLELNSINWLSDQSLALVAGNGFLVTQNVGDEETAVGTAQDSDVKIADNSRPPLDLNANPLPIWHPQLLQHLSVLGDFTALLKIFEKLEQKLKFFTEGEDLSPTLELEPFEVIASARQEQTRPLDTNTSNSLGSQLAELKLPKVNKAEQEQIKLILDTLTFVQEHFQSLDTNGLRYLFSWKLSILTLENENSGAGSAKSPVVPSMKWREIAFAYHSATQQPLLDILTTHYGKQLSWSTARQLGIPAWLRTIRAAQSEGSDLASLEQIFDSLAQTAYRAEYPPDPSRSALFFLALRKKATLQALWRVAVGNREQRSTMTFLKRDFSTEANKTAAKKNAYALMGKRRFEYAAAFFLLADDPTSAVRILAGQCEDLPLAIAVARVYCGDESPVFKKFMAERMLPEGQSKGDRWALSWAYDVLGRRSEAARALVAPIIQLQDADSESRVRTWQQDDPLALQLYAHLRDAPVVSTGNQRKKITGVAQYEYGAVVRSARILRRMGLWLPALNLIASWRFSYSVEPGQPEETEDMDGASSETSHEAETTPNMLDDFSSAKPAAQPTPTARAPKSMLDDFDSPTPSTAPKSMLDDFDTSPAPTAADTAKNEREAKAAALLAKMKAKKDAANSKPNEGVEKQDNKEPTQFKEPESNSILDSFGF